MTDQEIRIAIAECCGWKPTEQQTAGMLEGVKYWTDGDKFCTVDWLPDYLNDLNAMHEAEVFLENEIATADQYWTELAELTCADDEELGTCTRYRYIGNATARQRAEAFLRTIGKWKD